MARLTPFPAAQVFDGNGDPLVSGKVYTYEAGTTTPKTTFTDSDEGTANANPLILDGEGRGEIWLGDGAYKIRVFDSSDVLVDERDNVIADSSGASTAYDVTTNTNITSVYADGVIYASGSLALSLLPVADADDGFEFTVKNVGTGRITIDPDGSETINDVANFYLMPGESAKIYCDGDEWYSLFSEPLIVTDAKTADYTAVIADMGKLITVDATSAAATVTLPAAATVRAGDRLSVLKIDSTNTVTVQGDGAELINASNTKALLNQYDSVTVQSDGSSAWYIVEEIKRALDDAEVTAVKIAPAVFNDTHINGLRLSINGTDSDHDIDISAGNCINTDGGGDAIVTLAAALTKQIDATWAEGDDAGGMFTGSVANNTVYYVILITKDADGTVDAGFDTSASGANKPSGWTVERVLGSVVSNGSANIGYLAHWRETYKEVAIADQTITSAAALSLPHGMGEVPDRIDYFLVCQTDEDGYTAGDIVAVDMNSTSLGTNAFNNAVLTSETVDIRYSSSAAAFNYANKTTGAVAGITNANWKLRVKARVSR